MKLISVMCLIAFSKIYCTRRTTPLSDSSIAKMNKTITRDWHYLPRSGVNTSCVDPYLCKISRLSTFVEDQFKMVDINTSKTGLNAQMIKDNSVSAYNAAITKIEDGKFKVKHPMKRNSKQFMSFQKRKQTNRIRHQMQGFSRRTKQSQNRGDIKHSDSFGRPAKLSKNSASYTNKNNLKTDDHNGVKHLCSFPSCDKSLVKLQVEKITPKANKGRNTNMFHNTHGNKQDKKHFTEEEKKSHVSSHWLLLTKVKRYDNRKSFRGEAIVYNGDMIRVKPLLENDVTTNHATPTPFSLRLESPNITWGRAQTQTATFANPSLVNITARDGEQARLPCTVLRLEQGEVSWIRKRDLHILTVGRTTYTSDQRFRVLHGEGSLDWTLIIGPTTLRDAGTYECQVSTKPKISRPVNLIIAVERAEIQGPKEIFIRNGSTISLTCIIKSKSEDLGSVAWTKDGVILDYDSPRGGISLEVEKTPTKATTKLFITKARKPDSGTYICSPQFAQPASVFVHVVNGEESRAVQKSSEMDLKLSHIILCLSLAVSFSSVNFHVVPVQFSEKKLISVFISILKMSPLKVSFSTNLYFRLFAWSSSTFMTDTFIKNIWNTVKILLFFFILLSLLFACMSKMPFMLINLFFFVLVYYFQFLFENDSYGTACLGYHNIATIAVNSDTNTNLKTLIHKAR